MVTLERTHRSKCCFSFQLQLQYIDLDQKKTLSPVQHIEDRQKNKKITMTDLNSDPLTSVGSYSCLNPPNDPNETYFLTGIQLLGQLFYVVLLIETPWSGRAHAIVGGHHLWSIKIHTYIINCRVILCVNCVCTSDVQGC